MKKNNKNDSVNQTCKAEALLKMEAYFPTAKRLPFINKNKARK